MPLKAEETEVSATTTTAASELTMEIQEGTQYPDTGNTIAEFSATYDAANKVSANRYNQKVDIFGDNFGPIRLISQLPHRSNL